MKTLLAISDFALKRNIVSKKVLERLQKVSEVDAFVEGRKYTSEELSEMIYKYDAIITSWGTPKLTPEVLNNAGRLKFVGHAAGTVIPYVDAGIFDRDIAVVNANYALARSTAEHTIALMMTGAWNIMGYAARLKEGKWCDNSKDTVLGVYGQTVGLIGYGDICKEVIRLLKPFDCKILLYSKHCTDSEAAALGVELCELSELMKRSSIISLHNTLTPASQGMLGKEHLSLIRDGALLVNTARGPIIQEGALIDQLSTGRFYAALDVYENEPVPENHPLLQLPNVICTPHIGGFSRYWKTRLAETVIEDLERYLAGKELQGLITREKYNRLTPK